MTTNNTNNDLSKDVDVEVKVDRNHSIFGHFIMSDELATFLHLFSFQTPILK